MRWLFILLAVVAMGLAPVATHFSGVGPNLVAQATGPAGHVSHVVWILMENRSTDDLFADDSTLVTAGFNASLTASLQAWQTTAYNTKCKGNTVGTGCYMIFHYPLSHVPLTYSTANPPVVSSYDLGHTHNDFQRAGDDNTAIIFRKDYFQPSPGPTFTALVYAANQNGSPNNPNFGEADFCQSSPTPTPSPSTGGPYTPGPLPTCGYANCKDQSAPGGCAGSCPTPTAIPPTPTPFPNSSPAPTAFPSGYGCALAYLNSADVQPYWDMAAQYAVADNSFQTNEAPSFPAHLYYVSGAAWANALATYPPGPVGNGGTDNLYGNRQGLTPIINPTGQPRTNTFAFVNNASGLANGQTGCDAPNGTGGSTAVVIATIDIINGGRSTSTPCPNVVTMFDTATAAGHTFKFYGSTENLPPYNACTVPNNGCGYYSYRDSLDMFPNWGCSFTSLTTPPSCPPRFLNNFGAENGSGQASPTANSQFLTDVSNCALRDISWVTPTSLESDHSAVTDGSGPAYVTALVNAIGTNTTCDGTGYWNDTVIFVSWDDWGGFYDHVAPHIYNSNEDGMRVPIIAIGPYVKPGYISHTTHEIFGSVLQFIEEAFGLQALGNSDLPCSVQASNLSCSDDLSDMFNWSQTPNTFVPIVANLPNMPKEGVLAVKGPHGNWMDRDYKAVIRYIKKHELGDNAVVDDDWGSQRVNNK